MDAVFTTGSELGWREYFSVSDTAQYDNHAFEIEIASSGRVLAAGEHETALDALGAAGVDIDRKCCEEVCGVKFRSGEVEHSIWY